MLIETHSEQLRDGTVSLYHILRASTNERITLRLVSDALEGESKSFMLVRLVERGRTVDIFRTKGLHYIWFPLGIRLDPDQWEPVGHTRKCKEIPRGGLHFFGDRPTIMCGPDASPLVWQLKLPIAA